MHKRLGGFTGLRDRKVTKEKVEQKAGACTCELPECACCLHAEAPEAIFVLRGAMRRTRKRKQ